MPDAEAVDALLQSRCDRPHHILGPHPARDGTSTVVRAFLPHARSAMLRIADALPADRPMRRLHADGLFQCVVPGHCEEIDYEIVAEDESGTLSVSIDPYRFSAPRCEAADAALFVRGLHAGLADLLGAHPGARDGIVGVEFCVWAPHASRVSVVGGFNNWDGRRHPMQRVNAAGLWELFIPGVTSGALYKFEIKTKANAVFLKPDPFALCSEPPPYRASMVPPAAPRSAARPATPHDSDRGDGWPAPGLHGMVLPLVADPDSWTSDAHIAAAAAAGWSHVEFAAAATAAAAAAAATGAHPGDAGAERASTEATAAEAAATEATGPEATGPETTAAEATGSEASAGGLLAPRPEFMPERLRALAARCRAAGLGVILADPGLAFPTDPELLCYDGEPVYEAEATSAARAPRFDLSKGEVRSVLLSQRAFLLDCCRADALVVEAEDVLALLQPEALASLRARIPGLRLIIRAKPSEAALSQAQAARLVAGREPDPHAVLGVHPLEKGGKTAVRALRPGAARVQLLDEQRPSLIFELQATHAAGLFETVVPHPPAGYRFSAFVPGEGTQEWIDPYAVRTDIFGEADRYLFNQGNHYRIYDKLGAHSRTVDGLAGVAFAVWAPNAEGVSVVGPFNAWDGRVHQMRLHGVSGVWETFVPGLGEGTLYKFELRARGGQVFLKSDPYAFSTEVPPATGSVVRALDGVHDWQDAAWMKRRQTANPWTQPIAIYEVHAGSWMRHPDGSPLDWRELASKLVPYVTSLGFTHIELLPIAEYPYEPSWGYQVSNFYAPTARFGPPDALMAFIDHCHAHGIGVILDWVAGHFPKDAHALAWFDGTHLYEHADPRRGEHPDWGTLIFNYGRHEVANFLIANALFWLEVYHFDGLRVDAVASMLYLDYSRGMDGNWIPNEYGGRENLEAIEFLKHVNSILHARFPGVLMIAEESTSWPNVSRPTDQGGLGFGFKWNMGWMHDVLAYFSTPPEHRRHQHGKLTFGMVYAFNENYILSLSHDEVVHLKRSLLGKMPGEAWARFANLRLLFTFMYAHPGKKLLFMGGELGQEGEWNHAATLQWRLLEHKPHRAVGWFFKELNTLYRSQRPLFEQDFKAIGFEWLDVDSADDCTLAFLRKGRDPREVVLFAANFSDVSRPYHRVGVPYPCTYDLLFHSASAQFGGSGIPPATTVIEADDIPWHGREFSIRLPLPALSAVVLKPRPLADDARPARAPF